MVWWIVAGYEDDGTIYANGDNMMDSWCYDNLNLMVWWIVDAMMDSWCYDGKLMLWQFEPDGMVDNW